MVKNAGISGALMQKESPQQVSTQFVNVESLEDYINKAKQLGAKVVKDKQEISEGYYAVLEDPQKNAIGIWQNK
jgi:predicted enzyme related to lactoylglutathione lyase